MYLDSYFAKGATHSVCQDYAAHFMADEMGSAALSDGCSSAPRSEIGAQLLTLSRLKQKYSVARHADVIGFQLGLNPENLIASLLAIDIQMDTITIEVNGDGGVYIKRKDGSEEIYIYEYGQNAPYYPIYDVYPRMAQDWGDTFQFNECRKLDYIGGETVVLPQMKLQTLERAEIEKVFLFSDGIGTFKNQGDFEMMRAVADIPNPHGQFLERKYRRLVRDFGLTSDDFSCIAFINL